MFIELTRATTGNRFLQKISTITRVQFTDRRDGAFITTTEVPRGFYVKETYVDVKTRLELYNLTT